MRTATTVECQNCGGMVSDDFARVFGDNDDVVHGCPECSRSWGRSERRTADVSFDGDHYPHDQTGGQEVESDD